MFLSFVVFAIIVAKLRKNYDFSKINGKILKMCTIARSTNQILCRQAVPLGQISHLAGEVDIGQHGAATGVQSHRQESHLPGNLYR